MKIINVFLIAFAIIFISYFDSFSFQKADSTEKNGDVLKTRPYAVQFAIGENFVLENFRNLNLSVKKHLSEKFALRLGLGTNISRSNSDGEINSSIDGSEKENNHYYFYVVVLDFNYYINVNDVVKAYLGAGPYFSYVNSLNKDETKYENIQYSDLYEYRAQNTGLGATLDGGVEWFLTSNISLFAEYNFLLVYSMNKNSSRVRDIDRLTGALLYSSYTESNGNTLSFRGEQLKFGISVYL